MAHVNLNILTPFGPSELNVPGTNNKLRECTPAQDTEPFYFSVEDVIMLTNQHGFHSLKKYMATFWGHTYPVWVGHNGNGDILEGVVMLACPPFYKPHASPGSLITSVVPPPGFPTLATLPPVV
jgi:hypothetical protein